MTTKTPNRVLFTVAHSKPYALEWSVDEPMGEMIDQLGEQETLEQSFEVLDDKPGDGVWVGLLDLVDDGPSDWDPRIHEAAVRIFSWRRIAPKEWESFTSGEYVWPDPDQESRAKPEK